MITRGTLLNPSFLASVVQPGSHMGYTSLDGNEEIRRMSGKLPGNCGLLSTLGSRLIYTLLPGKGKDLMPAPIEIEQLIQGSDPFWVYGDHKHMKACDGCGAICPQNVFTTAGREVLALQDVTKDEIPQFIRSVAYREAGIALLAKQLRNLIALE
ncbi:MAG TPA: hypothetical protein PKU95_00065 [Candidatus Dojkabacteria bacterium]|nr:hypothetical protein [Candidatus Dojkabacteria bacterium]